MIKTGLRKINIAYSRISFADICSKLRLESVDDVEFIVAKVMESEQAFDPLRQLETA